MLLDTYAWVELFRATPLGEKVRELIDQKPTFASAATYAELTTWALKNHLDSEQALSRMERLAGVLPLDRTILQAAGQITHYRKRFVRHWSLVDGMIYATAQAYGLQVVTGDQDFRGLPGVVLL